jgi:acyl-CoA dehydrogenase
VTVFAEQTEVLKRMLVEATPTEDQQRDTDWLLAVGELFTLVVYCQLVLENAEIYEIEDDLVDQIFDIAVRDFSRFAVDLNGRAGTTAEQSRFCMEMIRKPINDEARAKRIWDEHVFAQRDAYELAD